MARQLILSEREQIAHFSSQSLSKAEIARRLGGRHRSTIGRELARNSEGTTCWASTAQQKALARWRRWPRKRLGYKLPAKSSDNTSPLRFRCECAG